MILTAPKLIKAIDVAWRHVDDITRGGHLGAGSLGDTCSRKLWYKFRWVDSKQFPPRVLRLFDRGHREEEVFEQLLQAAGVEFYSRDPATNEQYVITFPGNKHIKGYADGVGRNLPDLEPGDQFIGEWKTHNNRSFKDLVKHGVEKSKPVHYTQMQLYMHQLDIPWALYGAVNKNDDHLYFEIIPYEEEAATYYLRRGNYIVDSRTPPARISENPGWYECKFCDFHSICHKGRPYLETCRSCQHVHPQVDGEWWCGLHDKELNLLEQRTGCGDHVVIVEIPF